MACRLDRRCIVVIALDQHIGKTRRVISRIELDVVVRNPERKIRAFDISTAQGATDDIIARVLEAEPIVRLRHREVAQRNAAAGRGAIEATAHHRTQNRVERAILDLDVLARRRSVVCNPDGRRTQPVDLALEPVIAERESLHLDVATAAQIQHARGTRKASARNRCALAYQADVAQPCEADQERIARAAQVILSTREIHGRAAFVARSLFDRRLDVIKVGRFAAA